MKQTIKRLIENHSLEQVERMLYSGQIGQLTYESYRRVWDWVTPRFSGVVAYYHEHYWNKHGKAAYYAKINRVRAAFGFEPYKIG